MLQKLSVTLLMLLFLMLFGCKISGTISKDEVALDEVAVSIAKGLSVNSDENGDYVSPDLLPLQYTVTPSKGGYIFIPVSKTVTLIDFIMGNTNDVDFSFFVPMSYTNSFGMIFNRLPSGTFTMGSPTDEPGRSDWETQHQVTLTQDFYMQATEVTQGQWEDILTEAENRGISIGELSIYQSWFSDCGRECPAESVSWDDTQAFIGILNQLGEGTYSLPTEAQWEYAARAGTTTAFSNGPITETGDGYDPNLDVMGWYRGNSEVTYSGCYDMSLSGGPSCTGPLPVAQKDANDWGLYDMHGNVTEWCQDLDGDYPEGHVTDPEGPTTGTRRVLRGGDWYHPAEDCRSANRFYLCCPPMHRGNDRGFRLVAHPVP